MYADQMLLESQPGEALGMRSESSFAYLGVEKNFKRRHGWIQCRFRAEGPMAIRDFGRQGCTGR